MAGLTQNTDWGEQYTARISSGENACEEYESTSASSAIASMAQLRRQVVVDGDAVFDCCTGPSGQGHSRGAS